MTTSRITHATLLTASLVALAACGGGDGSSSSGSEASASSAPAEAQPIAREALTEADLAGLELADLSMEIPWMENRVSRDPTPLAARAGVMRVDVSTHEAFDRALFQFTETAPFPGYRVEIVDATTPLTCGEEERTFDLGQPSSVLVHLSPARTDGDGPGRVGVTRTAGGDRLDRFGVLCATETDIVWAAGISDGTQVRVLELKDPRRLAVDLR